MTVRTDWCQHSLNACTGAATNICAYTRGRQNVRECDPASSRVQGHLSGVDGTARQLYAALTRC